jgi:hypothetical protein
MSLKDELLVPSAAAIDPNSSEILRVWIANGDQHVSLRTGVWEDPFNWGMMLADLAKHIVNSIEETDPQRHGAFERLREGLLAELAAPTDQATGRVIRGTSNLISD